MACPMSRTACLLVCCAWLAACAGSDTTRFYTLSAEVPSRATAGPVANTRPGPPPSVGLTPVSLPKYLDRPQLVARPNANAVKLNEFDKWSEPLADLVRRTLAADLTRLLDSDQVYLMPVRRAVPIERLVDVRISRFEADVDGAVTLEAQWQVYANDGAVLLAQRSSAIREPTGGGPGPGGPAPAAIVAAMSRALARLAHDIAAALLAPPGA